MANVSSSATPISGASIVQTAIDVYNKAKGKGYKYGGKTIESGFDCSGFVGYVFSSAINEKMNSFIRTADQLSVDGRFSDVSIIEPNGRHPGDIIIFPARPGEVSHIGIVLDTKMWIGSQSSTGVERVLFTNPYWSQRPHKFRRYVLATKVTYLWFLHDFVTTRTLMS